jgi:hypothetical protein
MIDRWAALQQLPQGERDKILSVLDALMRDANARRAYGSGDSSPAA